MCKASATDIDEPEWIGGDPRYHTVFETLVGFIAKAAENATERDELVDATIAILLSVGTQDPSMDEYKLDSLALFGILLTIVKQIDAATARHNAAVKLVMAIRNAPPPSSVLQTTDRYDRNREVHLQLTTFIGALSSFELDAPLHPCLEDRPSTIVPSSRPPWRLPHYQRLKPSEWASLNAFIAKVHAAESDILELDYRGLFAMIEALEEPRTESELEDVLPAATARIVYAGSALKINDFPYACYPTESKRMPWSRGVNVDRPACLQSGEMGILDAEISGDCWEGGRERCCAVDCSESSGGWVRGVDARGGVMRSDGMLKRLSCRSCGST